MNIQTTRKENSKLEFLEAIAYLVVTISLTQSLSKVFLKQATNVITFHPHHPVPTHTSPDRLQRGGVREVGLIVDSKTISNLFYQLQSTPQSYTHVFMLFYIHTFLKYI